MYACGKSGNPQECICRGGGLASGDAARSEAGNASSVQNAYRALVSCTEVSACGACNAACKDVAAKLTCGEASTPLSLSLCLADAGQDASGDASSDASSDADLDAADAAADGADASDDANDGAPPTGDAEVDAAQGSNGESGAPLDCSGCVTARCGDAKKTCGIASACDVYVQCVSGCADAACFERCGAVHASGKAALASLGSCTSANCSTECGL
jgi:hypothetical protein